MARTVDRIAHPTAPKSATHFGIIRVIAAKFTATCERMHLQNLFEALKEAKYALAMKKAND